MLRSDYGKQAGQYHPCRGSETGATFGAALLFLIRERGRLCHAGAGKAMRPCRGVMALAQRPGETARTCHRSPGRSWRRYALDLFKMTYLCPVRHAVMKTVSSTRVLPAWQGSWRNRDTQQRQVPTKDA